MYLLPGLGTDERLFKNLSITDTRSSVLNWPRFDAGMTLPGLARSMAQHVDPMRQHLLVGVSMGGMVAQEIAAITGPRRVVLISSWKGPQEWPSRVHIARKLGLHHLITDPAMRLTWPLKRMMLGQRDRQVDRLLYEMALSEGAKKIRTGAGAILRWKGSPWNGPLTRIHGDNDRIIPMRFPVDHVVRGGGHVMVLDRAVEVGAALRAIIGTERELAQ